MTAHSETNQRLQNLLADARRFLELMEAEPCELYAHALREAANGVYARQLEMKQAAEYDALAKKMSPTDAELRESVEAAADSLVRNGVRKDLNR